ncbi:MAG: response regulator [Deltaproteobacteria bacterium]|nr:response regulator [Deltaproteobacteria bacterium]
MLEHAGYRVETAAGGEEALDVYDKRGGDVRAVLLDMTMPRMDGEETFRELRRRHPGARVVLTSGFSKNEATRRFAGRGLAGFLQKPYRADTLVREIRRAVDPPGPDGD